jgi:hypothetical protein
VSVVCTQAHVFKFNVFSLASLQFHYVQNNIATRLYRMNPSPMTDGIFKAHNLAIAVYFSAHTANMRVRNSGIKFTHREIALLISAIETALNFHGCKGIAFFLNIVSARFNFIQSSSLPGLELSPGDEYAGIYAIVSSIQSSSLPELKLSPGDEYAGIYAIVTLVSFLDVALKCDESIAKELVRSTFVPAITRAIVSKECEVTSAPIDESVDAFIASDTQQEEVENCEDINSQARFISFF